MRINQLLLSTFLISVLLAACSAPAQSTPVIPITEAPVETQSVMASETPTVGAYVGQTATPVLPVDQLKNATYSGIYDQPITLVDGKYEGKLVGSGDASHPIVEFIDGTQLYGDLDGDGIEDAVVFLLDQGGGSGIFTYVSAQINREGQPLDAGAVMIEDRIGVKSAAVEDGQVRIEIITQGPGDPACCGSHKMHKTYALQDGKLAEIPGTEKSLEQVSAADLNGTSWILSELNKDVPALPDVEATLNFQDGQINGSGGCNHYNGTFSLGSLSPLLMTIDPLASTRMACPETISAQETSYLTALANVSHWGYLFGKLALSYETDSGEAGRLLFDPVPVPAASQENTVRGHTWQWVSFTNPNEMIKIDPPGNYTLKFNENGSLSIKADCNMANASYTDDNGGLKIQAGPMTMAQCPAGSRSEDFIKYLSSAARYFFQDGHLFIDLMADGGTMEFSPAD